MCFYGANYLYGADSYSVHIKYLRQPGVTASVTGKDRGQIANCCYISPLVIVSAIRLDFREGEIYLIFLNLTHVNVDFC